MPQCRNHVLSNLWDGLCICDELADQLCCFHIGAKAFEWKQEIGINQARRTGEVVVLAASASSDASSMSGEHFSTLCKRWASWSSGDMCFDISTIKFKKGLQFSEVQAMCRLDGSHRKG